MVILERETFKKFGYYPRDLTSKSHKRVIVACDDCGKIREIGKHNYYALCRSCAMKRERATPESRRKIIEGLKGRPVSKETRKKISNALKGEKSFNYGKHPSEETRRKQGDAMKGDKNPNYGKHPSEETKRKIRTALKGKNLGEKHPNWQGGNSIKYCEKWNEKFREYIRAKFGRVCFNCGKTEAENGRKLSVHHVSYDKACGCADTEEEKKADDATCQFVPLCGSCHTKVHRDRKKWEKFFINKMRNNLTGWYI